MKITSCRFEKSVFRYEDEPRAPGPRIVFLGRSNVGKSSLINRLLGVTKLARASSQPGRTQSINFYRINERWYFVDLPGYGFARVPEHVRRQWGPMIEGYLERGRSRIALGVLIVDARRDPTELDRVMHEWLDSREIPYVVTATKSDKLAANARARARRQLIEAFAGQHVLCPPMMVSARTGSGVRELWKHVDTAIGQAASGVQPDQQEREPDGDS